jgi:hypothetical protein
MKMSRTPKPAAKKAVDAFPIAPAEPPATGQTIDNLMKTYEARLSQLERSGGAIRYAVPDNVTKGMAAIATNAWKARTKMLNSQSGEPHEEMRRVYRHIEAMFETFQEMGLEVKDHTNDAFDYGMPLKVVTTQPTQGITKERVAETIKPTIYWQKQIIQMGEVVIATPA